MDFFKANHINFEFSCYLSGIFILYEFKVQIVCKNETVSQNSSFKTASACCPAVTRCRQRLLLYSRTQHSVAHPLQFDVS